MKSTPQQSRTIFLILLFLLFGNLNVKSQGFLKADGTQIKDENGNEIIFRGIGLGGWMLQEGYMLGTGGPQHELEARIEELVGAEKKEEFYDAWLANHMRKIDVDYMAAWGYNLIRLPMHYKLFTPPIEEEPIEGEITWREKGFAMTDSLLSWCKANNMYLILDLHAAPGGQGKNADISDYDDTKPSLWESEANQEKAIALWRKLADRYKDEPNIAGYDLINEPNWGFQDINNDPNGCAESQNTLLWNLQKDITEAIREVDQNHFVVIEGNCWGNNYSGLPTLWDDNLVISYHKYWNGNDQGAIQGMLDMRNERNVPIWLGETGENSNTWFTNAISLFEQYNMGWCWWPLKKLGSNNPLEIKRNDQYQAILDYWNNGAEKPSEADAYAGLMQLAEDLKLENNIYHKDVVDAKIRQPHTDATKPFVAHSIIPEDENIIYAVNYDLGKNGFAYFDNVVSNTSGSAGGTTWNNGYAYRNDGVDIEACEDELSNGFNVGWIEQGEWLLFTVQVEEAGNYDLNLRTASTNANGRLIVQVDGIQATESIELPNTGDFQAWQTTTVSDVVLKQGTNRIKLYFETGDFNINYFSFTGPSAGVAQPKILNKEGTHQKKNIKLLFNQTFEAIPDTHGFSVTRNGEAVAISAVSLAEDTLQLINVQLEESLDYYDEVLISYNGTEIMTQSGVALEAFSDELVNIVLAGGIIPHKIPGRIQAEDFVLNNGFSLEDAEDNGGGSNLSYIDNGDYVEYMVNVTESSNYEVNYRIASESSGGSLSLKYFNEVGTAIAISQVSFEATGGWQTWKTAKGSGAFLDKGIYTFRLTATSSLFNLNWFELKKVADVNPTSTKKRIVNEEVSIYPNPGKNHFKIDFGSSFSPDKLVIYSLGGEIIQEMEISQSRRQMLVEHNLQSGMYFVMLFNKTSQAIKKIVVL